MKDQTRINYFCAIYVSQTFVALTKYLTKQLKGGKIYFGSQFQSFRSIMATRVWQTKTVHIKVVRKQQERDT
jgi:hypothetical protein